MQTRLVVYCTQSYEIALTAQYVEQDFEKIKNKVPKSELFEILPSQAHKTNVSTYCVKLWHFEITVTEDGLAIGQYFELVSGW